MSQTLGRLITFEGGEGAGKSTQIVRAATWLRGQGLKVRLTREPGGTPGAESIRDLVLSGKADRWNPMTELCLMMAARSDHLDRLIRPALAEGAWVLSDRFHDSSRVYQGIAGELGLDAVDAMHKPLLNGNAPDLTLLLDLDPNDGLSRRELAGDGSRFEAKTLAFHKAVRDGFRELAAGEPERFAVIDAAQPASAVASAIEVAITKRLLL